ncbi:4-coumarate-CoA ligase 1 [Aspergillus pseudotamarii]|uniref:4-coumarate-CoA ligase 1 n=1 Tax=Aspergillus pseudotamarii TaxID=132259 RepID=A0A5N6SMM0_ASPPS|nr:4-coumarate-CoA ligase 1 [Aspergillus pseudotamarii]KAE8135137.1 4-coumarate-CoA ligase 1 [Aspergillus pseudotamarii]
MQTPKISSYVKSRWQASVPRCSLPRFVFGSPQDEMPNQKKLIIDTARPEDRSLSLAEYRSLSVRIAVGLQRLRGQPKDRVLCLSGNCVSYAALLMGTIMAGCIFVPGQPGYGDRELENLLIVAKPSVILTQRVHADALLRAARTTSSLALARHAIFIFDDNILDATGEPYLGIPHWQDMVGSPAENDWEYPDIQSPQEYHSTIVIMFTSGTTGKPKGVEISHCNYISAAISYMQRVSRHPDWQQAAQDTENPALIRVLGALGMHHILGQRSYSVIFPKLGVPLYLLCQPNSKNILHAVERFNITDAIVRSSILTEIAKIPHLKSLMGSLGSLKRVEACAAPMPESTKTILEDLGIDRVTRVWGLTELGLITGHDMNCSSTSHSVGELHANYEGKVTNTSNPSQIVHRSTIGDIWIRAPSCSVGYYENAEATQDAHGADGWFQTGDVGYVDEGGQWYIVDRKKDLIKVNGNHVAPTELEAVLLRHPEIVDVGIIGVAVNQDEGPRAYIETTTHSVLSSTDIHQFMVDKVAPYKYLSGGVSFIPRIPRNVNGKILRAELRELAKKELGGSKGHYHGWLVFCARSRTSWQGYHLH